MEKFLKSIFTTSDKKKTSTFGEDEKNDFTPPFDERRKLSISRSGKMKQANKIRNSLSTDLYGQNDFQPVERPKTLEYHVNNAFKLAEQDTKKSADKKIDQAVENSEQNNNSKELTPEEQIENAFDIIDKAS